MNVEWTRTNPNRKADIKDVIKFVNNVEGQDNSKRIQRAEEYIFKPKGQRKLDYLAVISY